ncbi:Na(+)/H(+) antiporter subunit G [Corynebacterium cystitidis DSM 20524]|uniref:Multicomponent Na+:H+ antiporter subunit G n=1 Tax=Corynebacterium cystitidis DSM 20524 TaxID=1121357 RepID=A0A1H9V6G6_9CORY|nr:Na(+)/H(+) antiporter subunit G [Corynebacterium cystitidis DSM 20524]SES16843.1 multicomponent Na+:H+ antiporter subunit G [Corynebacterium cystitidis DSM 20524]SNV63072.1 monovalent cation/H+ antiporter subunit G [Corynebacterium cystitidis]
MVPNMPDITYALIADIISLILIISGSFLVFSAAVGVIRFKDTMSRIHAITKPQTTGLILMVIGTILRLTGSPEFGPAEKSDIGVLVLLILFALMTNPVTAQRLGRVSRREALYGSKKAMSRNDAPADHRPRRAKKG